MHASVPVPGRTAARLVAGALALCLAGCGGAGKPAPEATAPANSSAPVVEVAVIPEATAAPEATSTATEPAAPKTVFYMSRPFKGDPQLMLTRVTKLPDSLKLHFAYTNKSSIPMTIKVSPIGDANAMYVELPDGRRLEFRSADGISIKPQDDRIEPGDKQRFSLTFDPLPDGVTKFDVFEGVGGKNAVVGQTKFWYFHNIQLK